LSVTRLLCSHATTNSNRHAVHRHRQPSIYRQRDRAQQIAICHLSSFTPHTHPETSRTMQLKRKRSDSEISTSSSLLSSPPSASSYGMAIDSVPSQQPHLFSARTRKRHRDNRPDENTIHLNTLSMLYSAQQQPSSARPLNLPPPAFQNLGNTSLATHAPAQPSLHSFWALPKRASSSRASSLGASSERAAPAMPATNCEDCDACLSSSGDGGEDAMDIDVDLDMMGGMDWSCCSCGKQVCRGCAVSNLGETRRCLGCAGMSVGRAKRWEGGIGWVNV
ncbi:orf21 protein, partial [Phlyctema vagabunda]